VVAHRLLAEHEPRCDRGVGEAPCHEIEDGNNPINNNNHLNGWVMITDEA
jgi:hypothetical protein